MWQNVAVDKISHSSQKHFLPQFKDTCQIKQSGPAFI